MSSEQDPRRARINDLSKILDQLPIDPTYRECLQETLFLQADVLMARPKFASNGSWDDLEALQQMTLANAMERKLREILSRAEESGKPAG